MTANNGWPGKPGWPLHPERDGWHWVKARPEKLSALREKVPALWTAGNQHWIRGTYPPEYAAENWLYLGPVLTPDEAAALQKRVAELEAQNEMLRHATDKLRAMLAELNARYEPLQRAFITAVELLNDAALEGKKDE